ncbi:UDP:flavonoid glycosyltransferase YjiC (YdhE family) [Kitasatospora gansuensis]|uniref:UDP:flavonoid glycosyltransferase YjiC (YdhE family) n=1 Tax=Kitasatospora gansuensis TaxID=258050 RepID=A0A7W7WFH6_9ACTN|nr:nucleotide disphospho-sugar-binding domain-containing protein [Kitasatospora gansuensis]MBB4944968.1 UDP:flavonoid glycosyltransferase YjiC (YdhE family) [Kitasatospora gansuensis]
MRILFTGPAAPTHVFPMVPTAQALRAAGHEVLFASPSPMDQLRQAGFPIVEIGDGRPLRDSFVATSGEQPRYARPDLTQDQIIDVAAAAFAHASRATVDGLLATASEWGADLLIHDSCLASAQLVAAKLKIPAALQNFGFISGLDMAARLAGHFTDLYEAHGVAAPAETTPLNVVPVSLGGDAGGLRMRYIPYNGGGVVPADLLRRGTRPRVAVTLGTVVTEVDGVHAITRLIEAAASVDAEFLLAVGDADLSHLGTLPANVRPLPWVPLAELLRVCDAVIHHGGSGSALTAVQAGIPQLVLPQGADNFLAADILTGTGAALRSSSADVDTPLLARLIGDAALREAAVRLRAENDALPTPAALVPAIEALATGAR